MERVERINDSLRQMVPMLPSSDYDNQSQSNHSSAFKSKILNKSKVLKKEESKILSEQEDRFSMRSVPMSAITRRSNFTMLTLKT